MSDMNIVVYSYTAAVRGHHYYKQYWNSVENEELCCLHENFNFYDSFAVNTVRKNGETLGYLPNKLSRVKNVFFG